MSTLTIEKLLETKRMLDNLKQESYGILHTHPLIKGDTIIMNPALAEQVKQATRDNEPTMGFKLPEMLFGMKIIEHSGLTKQKQIKFPRSKKKRIQRKWRKRWTVTVPSNDVFIVDTSKLQPLMSLGQMFKPSFGRIVL